MQSIGQNDAMDSEILPDPEALSGPALRRHAWRQVRPTGAVETLAIGALGWDAGRESVDRAIDGGAGVLLLLDQREPSVQARAIAALYSASDASSVVPVDISDLAWMELCSSVREAMVELRPLLGDSTALLAHDQSLACQVAAIVQAAARRTPIVLVGVSLQIAAMAAARLATQSTAWVFLALQEQDAAAALARKRLGLTPWADLQWQPRSEATESIVRSMVEDLDASE